MTAPNATIASNARSRSRSGLHTSHLLPRLDPVLEASSSHLPEVQLELNRRDVGDHDRTTELRELLCESPRVRTHLQDPPTGFDGVGEEATMHLSGYAARNIEIARCYRPLQGALNSADEQVLSSFRERRISQNEYASSQ